MGLKCQKCGEDNLFTAIYCVKCGEKIDLTNISVDTLTKKPRNIGTIAKKIFKWVFILLVVCSILSVASIFIPASGRLKAEDPAKEANSAYMVLRHRRKPAKGVSEILLSSNDMTNLLTRAIKKKFDAKGNMVPRALSVTFLDGNRVKVVLTNSYWNSLKVDSVVIYSLEVKDRASVEAAESEKAPAASEKAPAASEEAPAAAEPAAQPAAAEPAAESSEESGEEKESGEEAAKEDGAKPAEAAAPAVPENILVLTPVGAKLGHFPLPSVAWKYPARQVKYLLGNLKSLQEARKGMKSVRTIANDEKNPKGAIIVEL